ncbi:serine hydrolase [Sutcliffiella sp. NC1]|uniref:serine hydrolase n=1 Tax=Sutcliffiella sp. NC1 TaxID=3004096 RepID=UPI0022DDFCB7|nr:serine hydrolase [Sutcliffiella sp. NC1]WBL16749.1 serine hydrolase [Sutcliffiella sp. NC1]
MYLYLWIVFVGFILLHTLPLLSRKNRTRWKITQAILVTSSVLLAVLAIEFLIIPPLIPIIFVIVVSFLTDKSTYTKRGLIIAGIVLLFIAGGAFYLFHDDPNYVENYIKNNPELASMHVSVNGEVIVSQESDVKRPLASVVKTIVAIAYANEVVKGTIDSEERIPLDELEKFHLANTDGGAHPAWLNEMREAGKVVNNEVSLQEVAKGMIRYSSNANTDFLLEKLGEASINRVVEELELENHDPVFPIVASLLASEYINDQHGGGLSNQQLEEMLQSITLEEYRELAWEIHNVLKKGEAAFFDGTVSIPMELQKIWSNRLPNATVEDYGKVMEAISNDKATLPGGEGILREIMEWPMELHTSNREKYAHFGAKGGSTAFVLNQALYIEDKNGKKIEVIIFTEGFNFIEFIKMNRSMNSFLLKVLNER